MSSLSRVRVPIVGLLILCSVIALAEGFMVNPSYAQPAVQSHANTNRPPSFQNVAASSSTTNSASTSGHGNGRRGSGVPPGLLNAWAHSNMSVVARAVTHAIFLNGEHGVELAQIAIAASSNGQLIENVATNETVAQVDFDHDGAVELDVNSSAKPAAVFADDNELTEAQWNVGLTPNSNAWAYDQNSHMLKVFADPSSITIFYGQAPMPVPEFPAGLVALTLVGSLATALLVAKKTKHPPIAA